MIHFLWCCLAAQSRHRVTQREEPSAGCATARGDLGTHTSQHSFPPNKVSSPMVSTGQEPPPRCVWEDTSQSQDIIRIQEAAGSKMPIRSKTPTTLRTPTGSRTPFGSSKAKCCWTNDLTCWVVKDECCSLCPSHHCFTCIKHMDTKDCGSRTEVLWLLVLLKREIYFL